MSESPTLSPTAVMSRQTLGLLARGPFGRYAAGTVVSQTGTWMQGMAQNWVMTSLTTSNFTLSLVQACTSLPMLALTMYGGTVADRFDKRKILIATQVVQLTLALAVGLLILAGRIHIWHLLTAAFLLGISASFEMPADSALVPELVDKENIANAIAVDRSIFHGTRLIGPAIAGQLIDLLGAASAFFANALSFLALIGALATIHPRARGTAEEEQQRHSGMKAGVDYVRRDRPTMAMLGIMAANASFIFPFMAVLTIPYARHDLGLGAGHASWLMTVSGVGSLAASVWMLRVPRERRVPVMAVATGGIVAAMLALSVAQVFWQALSAMVVLAAGTSLNYGLANTTVQERAPGPMRGRVSALAMMSFVGVMPFASMGVARISDAISIRHTIVGCALAYGVAAFYLFTGPARRTGALPARVTPAPVEV